MEEKRGKPKKLPTPTISNRPSPPSHLSRQAKVIFNALVDLLDSKGTLDKTDSTLIEIYAINADMLRLASLEVQMRGTIITTDRGAVIANPACAIVNACSMRLKTAISDMGLCPATFKESLNQYLNDDDDEWQGMI